MKKQLLVVLTAAFCLAGSLAVAQNGAIERKNGIVEQEPNGIPTPVNYLYPDNSDKKPSDFEATRKNLQEMRMLQSGAKIRQIKLVSYDEYVKEAEKDGGSIVQNMEVHPKRQFFMVDIEAPEIEIPQRRVDKGEPQSVKIKNARIKQVYDAETGEIFGSGITGTK